MIDDTRGKQRRPTVSVSFHDLAQIGITVDVQEFPKTKPDGQVTTAVKVLRVTKDGKNFPKSYMMEMLRVLGVDISEKIWVRPKTKHRALTSQTPVYDYRYEGYERTDKEHLSSGRASMEAQMFASNMKDMSEVAENLKQGGGDS